MTEVRFMESRGGPDMTEVRVLVHFDTFRIQKRGLAIRTINKNIKIVNLEILKVKTWFWNKDLSSLDSIN